MSDLVGNPEDRFSRVEAHIISAVVSGCKVPNINQNYVNSELLA